MRLPRTWFSQNIEKKTGDSQSIKNGKQNSSILLLITLNPSFDFLSCYPDSLDIVLKINILRLVNSELNTLAIPVDETQNIASSTKSVVKKAFFSFSMVDINRISQPFVYFVQFVEYNDWITLS